MVKIDDTMNCQFNSRSNRNFARDLNYGLKVNEPESVILVAIADGHSAHTTEATIRFDKGLNALKILGSETDAGLREEKRNHAAMANTISQERREAAAKKAARIERIMEAGREQDRKDLDCFYRRRIRRELATDFYAGVLQPRGIA